MTTKRPTREDWLERVRSWKESGESRVAFVKKKSYSESALGWWARKLASEGESLESKPARQPRVPEVGFVEVLAAAAERGSEVTLRAGKFDLLLSADFDTEALGRVLDVLESRS